MATRPSPRSSDGIRPRTKSGTGAGAGRPPSSSPRISSASRHSTGRSSASPDSDKPMPSFLRPTVSSSLHSSTSALTSSSSFKRPAGTARRSADKTPAQPLGSPRPITPKDKAKAPPASTSRWSAVSAKQLMHKASNAIKATKSRSKTSKEAASSSGKEAARPATSASVKEVARTAASSSGKEAVRPAAPVSVKEAANSASSKQPAGSSKGDTAREKPVEQQQQQPEPPAELLPAVQAEETVPEPKAEANVQHAATSQEVAGTDITAMEERGQPEEVSAEQPTEESAKEEVVEEEEKRMLDDAEANQAMNVWTPEPEEQMSQSFTVAGTETEAQKNAGDESPAVVAEEVMKEAAAPEGEDEPAIRTAEETEAEERQQEEARKPENVVENSETSEISEEPKEETSVIIEEQKMEETSVTIEEQKKEQTSLISELSEHPNEGTSTISEQPKEGTSVISDQSKEHSASVEKQGEVAEEATLFVTSNASAPTTPGKGALGDEETEPEQVNASEPVTPLQLEAVGEDKAVIETPPSAPAPLTPSSAVEKAGGESRQQATIPDEESSNLTFKGSKVKTAMEKRSDEEQPKKKEVARSNDVIEEAKSRLLEKRKSKVRALVGAFETVMDSPHG